MRKKENIDNLELRSEEVQEILTNPPAWIIRWGISLIFLFTLIILTLAFIIKYPDFVTSKVLVTTAQPTERVVSRYSGQLEEVFVQNRDTVQAGEILAIIRNTSNLKDVYRLKQIIDTLNINSPNFEFPLHLTSGLILGEISLSMINFEKNYTDYRLLKTLDPYSNRLRGNRSSLTEIRSRLKNQISQKSLLEQEFELKKTDYDRHKTLFEKGIISQQEFERNGLEFLQMQKNINSMAISISQMREAISSATSTLTSTRINKEEDQTKFRSNLSQSLLSLQDALRDWEYKYVLKSSIDGVVSFQDFWGANQFVNSGKVIFSVLPLNTEQLVAKSVIPAQNAGKVKQGQKVLIKLDNYPYQQYGMLIGKVKNFSISPNDDGNYVVYIAIPEGTTTSYNKTFVFNQELLGNADIITEDLSVAARLFYKFKELFTYN